MNNKKHLRKTLRKVVRIMSRHSRYRMIINALEEIRFLEKKDIIISLIIFGGMRSILILPTAFIILLPYDLSLLLVVATVYVLIVFFLLAPIFPYIYLYLKYKNADLGGFCLNTYNKNQFNPYEKHW